MLRVITSDNLDTIHISKVLSYRPIFAKRGGKLRGMIVREGDFYYLSLGDTAFSHTRHTSRMECMEEAMGEYTFHVEKEEYRPPIALCLSLNNRERTDALTGERKKDHQT